MVCGQGLFETVLGDLVATDHRPGIVDQQIHVGMVALDLVGGSADRCLRGQIQFQRSHRRRGGFREDPVRGLAGLADVAAGQDDLCVVAGEYSCRLEAQTRIRSGDDNGTTGLVGDLVLGPASGHDSLQIYAVG